MFQTLHTQQPSPVRNFVYPQVRVREFDQFALSNNSIVSRNLRPNLFGSAEKRFDAYPHAYVLINNSFISSSKFLFKNLNMYCFIPV